jgi:translation initiation factor 2B subunit (eIF-2B alpha/beta/delta family)
MDELDRRIELLALDRESGASEILEEVVAILRQAIASNAPLLPVARGLCRAQPAMASVWNAAMEVLAPGDPEKRLGLFARRAARAPEAVARFAGELFLTETDRPLRVVTISFSRSVLSVLEAVAARRELHVSCGEGRPALEGRRLASRLASVGAAVTTRLDAAIGQALDGADAVIVGADAVTPEWFLNKIGTRMLGAAAALQGVPLYVVATLDKFVNEQVATRLQPREGAPEEVWADPPKGVSVRNPYFEPTSNELVTTFITDTGLLGAALAAEVCASVRQGIPRDLILKL